MPYKVIETIETDDGWDPPPLTHEQRKTRAAEGLTPGPADSMSTIKGGTT